MLNKIRFFLIKMVLLENKAINGNKVKQINANKGAKKRYPNNVIKKAYKRIINILNF